MAVNAFRRLITAARGNTYNKIFPKHYSIYEPDYLEALKPKYPVYPPLTVQIRGYDYPILESYQAWMHKIIEAMDFDIEDSYAMPAKQLKVLRYKPMSTLQDVEYFLNIYQRNFKLSNVPAVRLPIFVKIVEAGLPEGVMLDIFEFDAEIDKQKYIPDKELLDMKEELSELTHK